MNHTTYIHVHTKAEMCPLIDAHKFMLQIHFIPHAYTQSQRHGMTVDGRLVGKMKMISVGAGGI